MSTVRPLASTSEVLDASGGDTFIRSSLPPDRAVRGWAVDSPGRGAVAWLLTDSVAGWLTVVGEAGAAARLVNVAAGDSAEDSAGDTVANTVAASAASLSPPPNPPSNPPLRALTVPRRTLPLLPPRLCPVQYDDWDWFWTDAVGQVPLPGEERVQWLTPDADGEVVALLERDSPRHSARPGERFVRRWCGIRDVAGGLVACAAHVEYVAGVPQLASIVTRRDARGKGLGAAVTSWLTRRLLDEGHPIVTLGMYADNDVARRMYEGLGYRLEHRFSSGRLHDAQSPPAPR